MNQYLSSVSLKSLAKGQLLGKYGTVIGAFMLQLICTLPISMAISFSIGTNSLLRIIFFSFAVFLYSVFSGYFIAGQAYIYLKLSCNQTPLISDLFHFFKEDPSKILGIQAVLAGVSVVVSLPALIAGHYMNSSITASDALPNAPLLLLFAVLYIAASVIDIFVRRILFSQIFYLMLDFPDYSVSQLLKMSIQLIKGSKGRLLYLLISFIPLILLGVFSFGIAFLWLYPYMQATYANFYLDLVKKKK